MKRAIATALAFGAAAAMASPAQAVPAVGELALYSNWQPVTIKVNGKGYVVDGGSAGYDWTIIPMDVGTKVTLEAPASPGGMKFCGWYDGLKERIRKVTIRGGGGDNYVTDYGRPQDC